MFLEAWCKHPKSDLVENAFCYCQIGVNKELSGVAMMHENTKSTTFVYSDYFHI